MPTPKDVLTFPKFLAWAKAKPQDETFSYASNQKCSVAQFLTDHGFKDVIVYTVDYTVGGHMEDIPQRIVNGLERLLRQAGTTFTFGELVTALKGRESAT